MRVPEEINRRIVDHTADINLTYSQIARQYLIAEGLPADMIITTGSPMKEVLSRQSEKIVKSDILSNLDLNRHHYFVVSAHREENIQDDKNFEKLVKMLNGISEEYEYPVIVSTHPRTRNRIDSLSAKFHKYVRLLKPLGFNDYNKLQIESTAVLSDSGTITEESSIMNFPALNIREAHERPEGMEQASVIMVGLNLERALQGLSIVKTQNRSKDRDIHIVEDYNVDNVSQKVVRIIHSYVDYVNHVIWKKY